MRNRSRHMRGSWRIYWMTTGLAAVILLPLLVEPISFDNAIIHLIGLDIVNHRLPYVDIIDHAFPGMMFFNALQAMVTGYSDVGQRVIDIALQAGFAGLIYLTCARWLPRQVAVLSALLYICFYLGSNANVYGESDVYIGLMIVAAFGLMTSRLPSLLRIGGAASLVGLSLLFRPTSLIFFAVFGVYIWLNPPLKGHRVRLLTLFLFVAAVPMIAFLALYSNVPNGLARFYELAFRFNLEIYGKLSSPSDSVGEFLRATPILVISTIGWLLFSHTALRKLDRSAAGLYGGLLASCFIVAAVQGKFFRYHLMPFYMFLVPLAAVGIWKIASLVSQPIARSYAIVTLVFIAALYRYQPLAPITFALSSIQHRDAIADTYSVRYTDSLYGGAAQQAVIAYFNEPYRRTATVEVVSNDPILKLHLKREMPTGFESLHILGAVLHRDPNRSPHFASYQLDLQRQYADALNQQRPQYLIVATHIAFWAVPDLQNDCLRYMPAFQELLQEHYRLDSSIGGYDIYRRVLAFD